MRHVRTFTVSMFVVWLATLALPASASASPSPAEQDLRALFQMQSPASRIGISVEDVQPDQPEGARVTAVEPDMPAAKAGVKEGDLIVEFDGERVRSRDQLTRLIGETQPGRAVKMMVRRDGKRVELTVTPQRADLGSYRFRTPSPEFREGPLVPPLRPRVLPRYPFDQFSIDPGIVPRFWRRPGALLGIGIQELTPQLRDYFGTKEGVLISSVTEGSRAARAGLKAGDVITAIDGRDIRTSDDVRRALQGKGSGDQVKVTVVRDHKTQTIVVGLGN